MGGDERKKAKERSSASSTDDTDVFGEGLESADCKAILFNCLKILEVKVKEIFDLANTTNESQIKGEQQLKCLTESVEFISARFDEYEADRKKKDDRQEQYSRRNCILIHGVKENQNEDSDKVVVNKLESEMDLEISPGDIDRIHRIGVPSKGKNRPMAYLPTKRD